MGNQFHQIHIAHRIEEMDSKESLLLLCRQLFGDGCDRDVRGVGPDNGLITRVPENKADRALLDPQIFGNRLNDQITVMQQFGLVLHIRRNNACPDALFVRAFHFSLFQDGLYRF